MLVAVFSCILWAAFLWWLTLQLDGITCHGGCFLSAGVELLWLLAGTGSLISQTFQWSYYAASTVNIFLLRGHISWQLLIPSPGGCSRWERPFFMPCPGCLSTRIKGFAQPEHIRQLPLQPAGSQSELPDWASKTLSLSCSASLGNISLHLKDLITSSLAPHKAGYLKDPDKQGTYILLQHVGCYLEIADGHLCCLCRTPSMFQGARS